MSEEFRGTTGVIMFSLTQRHDDDDDRPCKLVPLRICILA